MITMRFSRVMLNGRLVPQIIVYRDGELIGGGSCTHFGSCLNYALADAFA